MRAVIHISLAALLLFFLTSCWAVKQERAVPNGRITFSSELEWNEDIYVMNADGSNQLNLTNNLAWEVHLSGRPMALKLHLGPSGMGILKYT